MRRSRSGRTFASRWTVARTNACGSRASSARMPERSRARGPNRAAASAITSPTTWISPGTPSLPEDRGRALVGGEEVGRDPVDLDPVALLGHRQVAAAQPGLDVRDRQARTGPRSREGRVRVAVDEHRIGRPPGDRGAQRRLDRRDVRGAQVERDGRLAQRELLEEDGGERRVPVLAGVHDDLLDPRVAQRHGERRRLDELGPVADDRQQPHGRRLERVGGRCSLRERSPQRARAARGAGRGYTSDPLGPLAQLVEQGTLNPKVEGSNPSRPIRFHAVSRRSAALSLAVHSALSSGVPWARRANSSGSGRGRLRRREKSLLPVDHEGSMLAKSRARFRGSRHHSAPAQLC